MPINQRTFTPAEFRETLGHYPTGVAVVTAIDNDGNPIGMVVGSFASVSLEPPLVSFMPMKTSATFEVLRNASTFCVNVLAADQLELCRRFASKRQDKFEGIGWRRATNGAPILDGVVSWIECAFSDIIEAGDHYIVLGRALDLSVSRPSLPLLFFQGGYGRFALPSLVAPADPELLAAIRVAEQARHAIEELSTRLRVDCSVLSRVKHELVFVLTANHSGDAAPVPAGSRVPMVPPLGSAFLLDAPEDAVDQWIEQLPPDEALRLRCRSQLETVRERGYSLSLLPDDSVDRVAVMADYSSSTSLPAHDRAIRKVIASTVDLYEPELKADRTYSLHSIGMPIPIADGPPIVVRMSGLSPHADVATVEEWIAELAALVALIASQKAPAQER